jgi:hypothetical protein
MSSPQKKSPDGSEKNWEMLNYPVELNPFGSDEEEIASSGFDIDFEESTKNSSTMNPFSDEDDEVVTESDLEEVENPGERVLSSFDKPSSAMSARSGDTQNSPRSSIKSQSEFGSPSPVKITSCPKDESFESQEETKGSKAKTNPPPPPKPPRISSSQTPEGGEESAPLSRSQESLVCARKYLAPLAPMVYRAKKDNTLPCGTTMKDLSTQLRKLNCQLSQIEIVGTRLETQILRAITNGKLEWKKSKTVDEYVANVERKCEALRIESVLVRKYMDLFTTASHSELEKQMKAMDETSNNCAEGCQASKEELTELLVHLMHIKNELLCVETSSSPLDACSKSLKKSDSSSILKKGVKQTLKSLKKKL